MQYNQVESFLTLDIGTSFTTAALFDIVEGERRFVARGRVPTTLYPPANDISRGAMAAVQHLEEIVGRPLLGQGRPIQPERTEGYGVDACLIVSSVGSRLRLLVIGANGPSASKLAAEAVALPCVEIVGAKGVDKALPRGESHMGDLLTALHQRRPHVLVVAEDGATKLGLAELAQTITISARTGGASPRILFLGGDENAGTLQRTLGRQGKVFAMRPGTLQAEGLTPLQQRLQSLWQETWRDELPGSEDLGLWTDLPPMSVHQGFAKALVVLSSRLKVDVWGVDVGAGASHAVSVVGGTVGVSARPGLGVGQGSLSMLADVGALAQWLPTSPNGGEVADAVLNKYLHSSTVPETPAELVLDATLAREVAKQLLIGLPPRYAPATRGAALLVGRGAVFSDAPGVGHAMLLMLDAFQPVGLVELAIDRMGILPMLGAASEHLQDISDLVLRDGVQSLGPCIGLAGIPAEATIAANVSVERAGPAAGVDIPSGTIKVLPLAEGEKAKITVRPSGKIDCGAGAGRKATFEVEGGPRGVVVDARGRPLVPGSLRERRASRLAEWRAALGA